MTIATEDEVLVLPPFSQAGKGGLCRDYDADCLELAYPQHAVCWEGNHLTGPCCGLCPFMD